LRFQSTQPENSRNDWIATGRIRQNDFAGAPPTLEDRARWRIVANFLRDLHFAEWRKPAATRIAKTEFGGGDRVSCHEVAVIEQRQLLIACANHDLMPRVGRRTRRNK
jgi:hypothetical protein